MLASSDNIYPGCVVKKDGLYYTVIKVNGKSFYAWEKSWKEWNEIKNLSTQTFKALAEFNGVKMYKYGEFTVDESETVKKESITSNNYKIDKVTEVGITTILNEMKKKKKNYLLMTFNSNGKMWRVLEEKEGVYCMNIDNTYFLYSPETGECCNLGSVYQFEGPVPWKNMSKFCNSNT